MANFNSLFGIAKFLTSSTNEKINILNKGIKEAGKIDSSLFFQNCFGVGTIVSGDTLWVRNSIVSSLVKCSTDKGLPVIVIHANNQNLVNDIHQRCNISSVSCINAASGNFAPFMGIDSSDVIDLIIDSAPEKYDIKQNARYYLEAVTELMNASKIQTSFKNYLTCPHATVMDRVDNLMLSGKISNNTAQSIRSKLMIGQSESFKIDSYLHSLGKQIGGAAYNKKTNNVPVSIFKSLSNNGIISIDVNLGATQLYIDFIIEQIKLASLKGHSFAIVVDSLKISEHKKFKEFINSLNNNTVLIVSSDDIVSTCGGDERLFSSLITTAKQYVVLSHSSGISATQWANVLGEYEKLDENITTGKTTNEDGLGWASYNIDDRVQKTRNVSVQKKREYIIPPERIISMQHSEAYIRSAYQKGIIHGFII